MTSKPPKVPEVGKNTGARVDQKLHDDLAVIMRSGCGASDAIKWAVELGADLCKQAWSVGGYPRGATPKITGYMLVPYRRSTPEGESVEQRDA